MLFKLVPGDFSDLKKQNNYNSNWKKLLGFRNLQEKLENIVSWEQTKLMTKFETEIFGLKRFGQKSATK